MKFFQNISRGIVSHGAVRKSLVIALMVLVFAAATPLVPAFVGVAHAAAAAATTPASTAAAPNNSNNCGINLLCWALGNTVAAVATFFFYFAGYIFGIVGIMFNWVVVLTVFQFGAYFGNSPGMLIAWGVLRDVGNIMLLFGFIFMGILMILDLHNGIDTKKAIPGLIIFAVLLNFSLFASEAVVDVSNVLSAAIFNQAGQCTSTSCLNSTATSAAGDASNSGSANASVAGNNGIAGVIMSTLGLNTLFNPSKNTTNALDGNPMNKALFDVGASVFISIAMFVMLAGAIMLLIRSITLSFLLVVSPIGFAAMAIPPLQGLANKWWSTLLSQSFFAPVFLLLILVSVKILTGIGTQTGSGSSTSFADAIASPSSSNIGIFLIFALMIGFFIAALMAAKAMGGIGADFATNVAKNTLNGTFQGALMPVRMAGAPLYRKYVGGTAERLSGLQTNPGLAGKLARMANVATSGGLQSGLKKVQDSKFLGEQSHTDRQALLKHTEHDEHIAHSKQEIRDGLKMNNAAGDAKVEKALQSMSQEDYEKELENTKGAARAKLSKLVSADRAQKTMDSKTFHGKDEFMKERYGEVIAAAKAFKANNTEANFKKLKTEVSTLASEETDLLAKGLTDEFEILSTAVNENGTDPGESLWSNSQREHLTKSRILIKSQKDAIRGTARNKILEKAIESDDPVKAQVVYAKMTGKDAGEIGEDKIFVDGPGGTKVIKNAAAQVFVDNLNSERMKGLMTKDEWSDAAKNAVVAHWRTQGANPNYGKIKKYLDGNAGSYWGTL